MKKYYILLFTILLTATAAFAQNYEPLVDNTKMWTIMRNISGGGSPFNTVFTRFDEDTIINNINYLKVWETTDTLQQNWEINGFIREDIQSREVYYRDLSGNEGKLYDFSIEVNDTVEVKNTYFYYLDNLFKCYKIDSIIVNDTFRKRYHLEWIFQKNTPKQINEIWIEGVGSYCGVLQSSFSLIFGASWDLLCNYENGELVYSSPFNQCIVVGELCPKFIEQTLDTAFVNTYYEYQLEITPCPSDSIIFYPYLLPDWLEINQTTGLIYGTPTSPYTDVVSIVLLNWTFCTDWQAFFLPVVEPIGIKTFQRNNVISAHPVPASENVAIKLSLKMSKEDFTISCYDQLGHKVYNKLMLKGQNSIIINVSSWPQGMYVAIFYSNGSVAGKCKFVVEK